MSARPNYRVGGRAAFITLGLTAVLCCASSAGAAPLSDSATGPVCRRSDRPSIGLALSGGGARGGAHIGVLKALEELRVPVDCIAGTSVGAAIGGFYAAGSTAPAIEAFARGIAWSSAFANAMPRRAKSFRRKQDDTLFLVNLSPGLRAGHVMLPIGLNQGQVIDMIISRELAAQRPVHDFDRLSIPFRAIATDIATGDAVVLDSGDLALSLRASMSLPAVLAPIELDGRMLVDGGLTMNLPVQVAQALGADVVVAVDATSTLLDREALRSVVDVTNQVTTLVTQRALREQKAALDGNDILIEPMFDTRTTFTNFAAFADTIDDGYQAVMNDRARLEQWSLDADGYAAHVAARARPSPSAIAYVRLDNRSSIADSVIEALTAGIRLEEPLDIAAVEEAVSRVYGLQLFQNVHYSLVTDDTGTSGIEIEVDERTWGPGYIQFGLHYSSSSAAQSSFELIATYLRTGLNPRGGAWRANLGVGDEPEAQLDFYQPLGPKAVFFVEARLGAATRIFDVGAADHVATRFGIRETALEVSAGRVLGAVAELRAGVRSTDGDYRLRVGDPAALPGADFSRHEVFARLQADELDSAAFPRAGHAATIEWRSARPQPGAVENVEQVAIRAQLAHTWRRQTLLATLRYDTTVSGEAPLHSHFRLGGFRDLSGLARNELSGQNAARVGLSWYRRIGGLAMFPAFAGATLERGNVWHDRRAIDHRGGLSAGSVWAGISTPMGPIYLGAGRTEDGRDAVYLSLGGAF